MRLNRTLLAILAFPLVLAACAARAPSIADVKLNPSRYHDKRVEVNGVVTTSWGVPLIPFKLYKIDDGSGELTVVSRRSGAPTRGARVRVVGRVSDLAVIGGQPVGLHVEEDDLHVLNR
jgi:hypothetical protein